MNKILIIFISMFINTLLFSSHNSVHYTVQYNIPQNYLFREKVTLKQIVNEIAVNRCLPLTVQQYSAIIVHEDDIYHDYLSLSRQKQDDITLMPRVIAEYRILMAASHSIKL